jgi:tripartite-type tricarboxylate transporter receptor subunit TctC
VKKCMIAMKSTVSALLVLLAGTCYANADNYPNKPIHLIVGYGAGGGTDAVARAISKHLSLELGVSVVVENKPGAGGAYGANYVARSKPDGYTLLISSASSVTISPAMNPKLEYTQADFAPIAQISTAPLVLAVNKGLGINSITGLVKAAKAAPGKLNYSSSGIGSGPHLAGVFFNQIAETDMVHVPFRSGAPAVLSVISNDTQLTFATTPTVLAAVRSGQLTGLAVTTKQKSALMPELPGMEEAGLPGYEVFQWNGIFAPAGTPSDVVNKIYDALYKAMTTLDVKQALEMEGTEVKISDSPAAFVDFLKENNKFWEKLVKDSGATMD